MADLYTCEALNLTLLPDNSLSCTDWLVISSSDLASPDILSSLTLSQQNELLTATITLLTVAFAFKMILKFLNQGASRHD